MSQENNNMFYEESKDGNINLKSGFEISEAEIAEGAICNFKEECHNLAESAHQYTLRVVQIGGIRYGESSLERPHLLPFPVQEIIKERRERVVNLCSNCLVEHLMGSSEDLVTDH